MTDSTLLPCGEKETWKPIIDSRPQLDDRRQITFDAHKHIAYSTSPRVYTMNDLGYKDDTGISPIAASEPFKLFSEEAIDNFRDEVFHSGAMENCSYSGNLGALVVRGYAKEYAPFVYSAWHDPAVLRIVSDIAGVELVPQMDYEIGHINISVKSEQQAAAERNDASNKASKQEDDAPVVGWHRDSYPFVCVVMLSDCTNMIGGETVIQAADGSNMRIRGPTKGCAVVLQGRYVTHQALRALGAQERITMVTSFRPKSVHLPDDTSMETVRGTSNLSELYHDFSKYRLEIITTRMHTQLEALCEKHAAGERTDTRGLKQFLAESIAFLKHTDANLVPEEDVVPGYQPTMDIPDVKANDGFAYHSRVVSKL